MKYKIKNKINEKNIKINKINRREYKFKIIKKRTDNSQREESIALERAGFVCEISKGSLSIKPAKESSETNKTLPFCQFGIR